EEPDDPAKLADWFADGGRALVDTLRAADPDAPMWSWGADQHARFWSRRMLHETTVHGVDASLAVAARPAVDAAVAVDGIAELLENLPSAAYFRPEVAQLKGSGESIHLHATDADGEFVIHLGADGFTWAPGHEKATVA